MRDQGFARNFPSPINYIISHLTVMTRETDNGLQLTDKETDPEVKRCVLGHGAQACGWTSREQARCSRCILQMTNTTCCLEGMQMSLPNGGEPRPISRRSHEQTQRCPKEEGLWHQDNTDILPVFPDFRTKLEHQLLLECPACWLAVWV